MGEDPREVIERAARQHRQGASVAADPAVRARKERAAKRGMLEESLTGPGNALLVMFGIVSLGVTTVLFFVVLPIVTHSALCVLAGVPATAGALLGSGRLGTRALSWWRAREVRRIGRGFDASGYLEQLSCKRRRGRLVATLRFDDAWDADLRRSTADAVLTWCPDLERPRWDGDHMLHLQTAEIATKRAYMPNSRRGYTKTIFSNYPLHRCMARIARNVLPRLHAMHPVTRVEAVIRGEVCAFDAEP